MKKSFKFYLFANIVLVIGAILWLIIALANHWDIASFFLSKKAISMYAIILVDFIGFSLFFIKNRLDKGK
jgi:hypothetical protein